MIDDLKRTGVYCIRNTVNGKRYVGSTSISFSSRMSWHKCELNKGKHHSAHLQKSWKKYGESSFVFEIIEYCDPRHCIDVEQVFIDFYRSADRQFGYNICVNAGSCRGIKLTESHKRKISESNMGKKMSPESIEKSRRSNAGRKASDETKAKMSVAMSGKKMSDEAKRKMSAATKGRPKSQQHRDALSRAKRGKKQPQSWFDKMVGRKLSPEHVAKVAAANTKLFALEGESRSINEWSKLSGVSHGTIRQRIRNGWTLRNAVFTPTAVRKRK